MITSIEYTGWKKWTPTEEELAFFVVNENDVLNKVLEKANK